MKNLFKQFLKQLSSYPILLWNKKWCGVKIKLLKSQSGQSLMEVLIAMAIFIIGIATIGFLVLDANVSTRQGVERTQATLLAKEGLEVARSIRDADFDNLTAGLHGIVLSGNKWVFSGISDTQDQFTRVITVTDIDIDTKKIDSTVTWQFTEARQNSVTLTDYLTDWNQTQGDAGELSVDISQAEIGGRNKELKKIKIQNTGGADITIDKITVWWDNGKKIEEIKIDGDTVLSTLLKVAPVILPSNFASISIPVTVWSKNGPGTPTSKQLSGTELDIQDFVVGAEAGQLEIDKFKFDGDMTNATFIILFAMTDASTKYVLVELGAASPPPPCPSQSSTLVINTSGAHIGGGGNKELQGITIENTDANCDITIDKITATWDNGKKIEEIKIDRDKVWSKRGPGTPTSKQPSGTELDIQDFVLSAGSGVLNINKFKFNGNMTGATFSIVFTMSDGSTKLTGSFSP